MNNLKSLNLKPYPVDLFGNKEQVEVLPTFQLPAQKVSYRTSNVLKSNLYSNVGKIQLNSSLDSRKANDTAFTLFYEYNEEDYKTPITSHEIHAKYPPKRKSSRPSFK